MLKEKGFVAKLFSEKEGWGEWEPREVEGLGWLVFQVEDNAGSITLFVTEKEMEFPKSEDEWNNAKENGKGVYKMTYNGSYGNPEGEGTLYWNSVNGSYTEKKEYKAWNEGWDVLEEELMKIKV